MYKLNIAHSGACTEFQGGEREKPKNLTDK